MKRFVLAVAVLGAVAVPARGGILFDSSPPDGVTAFESDVNQTQYLANAFTLGSAGTLDGVNFWGAFISGGPTDPFVINLFADAAGHPGTLLSTTSATLTGTPNGGTTTGLQNYLFQSSIADLPLAAGTYWVSVYNTNPASRFYLVTHSSAGSFDATRGSPTAGPWGPVGIGVLAFQILGSEAVPEPSTIVMAGTAAMFGLGAWHRRRNRRGK